MTEREQNSQRSGVREKNHVHDNGGEAVPYSVLIEGIYPVNPYKINNKHTNIMMGPAREKAM
jgi:hypothetical protein